MFIVEQNQYASIDSYPFAWRWTDRSRRVIPPEDLCRIKPLSPETALLAWTYAESLQGEAYWKRFQEIDQFDINGRGSPQYDENIHSWLHQRLPAEAQTIFISWSERMAVETDRATFVRYWDTFCFPVEDVVIWPRREDWVLLFDYKQRFYFATERRDGA